MSSEHNKTGIGNRIMEAEAKLSKKKANQRADELYLGEPGTGTIIDVEPNPVNDFVEFLIELPNGKRAVLSFSEWDYEEGYVEQFLENIDCTVEDMDAAVMHSVPVTFTEWKGWVLLYGKHTKHLGTTYTGDSSWYGIDERNAHPHPNRKYSMLLSSPLLAIFLFPVVGLIAPIMGVVGAVALWYLNCMQVGMSMPKRKQLVVQE